MQWCLSARTCVTMSLIRLLSGVSSTGSVVRSVSTSITPKTSFTHSEERPSPNQRNMCIPFSNENRIFDFFASLYRNHCFCGIFLNIYINIFKTFQDVKYHIKEVCMDICVNVIRSIKLNRL